MKKKITEATKPHDLIQNYEVLGSIAAVAASYW